MLLALLVPGLGHFWAGRRARGSAFFLLVGAAFASGLALGGTVGWLPVRTPGAFLTTTAIHAVVAPGLLVHAVGLADGDPGSPLFEVAMTYLIVAGVMNVLLAFDAWDVAGKGNP